MIASLPPTGAYTTIYTSSLNKNTISTILVDEAILTVIYVKKIHRDEAMCISRMISSVLVQKQRGFNRLMIKYLIIFTCISYENILAISASKSIDIAPF